ncbi:hypothetical protein [Vibrio hangzhouensis]|uniref:Lipoprotein n=1 Tax=Vibrio hangzhouensis TaxID=462991 RepID=A0A1H6CQI9_9VIBR|nr:hypothetical protein [Vibrio hangzhouensis]MBY6195931.1 hypothetical protein [Vibrio hangzhouensis]SEG75108.1 hypothetical protein SAMN04488244_1543 [Vibrio hangzhouensis]
MKSKFFLFIFPGLMVGCNHTPIERQDSYELCQSLAYGYSEEVAQELERRGESTTDERCGKAKREKIAEIEAHRFLWRVEHSLRHETD